MDVYGVIIPIKTLSNYDLNHYAKLLKINHYRGNFMRDTLPKKPNKIESGIVNLDDSTGPGQHWVCYFINNNESFYFDSYGLEPPNEVFDYLKNGPLHYSTNEIQERGTVICGHLCLYVLKSFSLGFSFKEIIFKLI